MTTSAKIIDYQGHGNAASRPASLTLASGAIGLWWNDDTFKLDLWDGSAWNGSIGSSSTVLAPTIVQMNTVANNNVSSGITLGATPTSGNLLVCVLCAGSTGTPVPNTNWTQLRTGAQSGGPNYPDVLFKWAGAGESTTQAPTTSGFVGAMAIYELSGATAIEQIGGTIANVGSTCAQAITSKKDGALVLAMFSGIAATATLPTSITNGTADTTASLNTGLAGAQIAAPCHATIATGGSSLTITANYSGSQTVSCAFVLVHGH